MVMTPSRTQSITPYMNRRIVQSTSRIQIGDLGKEKDDACTEHISRILLTLSTSPLDCGWKDVLIADIVSLTGRKRSLIVKRERLIFGFLQFLFDILIKPSRNCPAQSYLQESAWSPNCKEDLGNKLKIQFPEFFRKSRLNFLNHEIVAKGLATEASAMTIALPGV